MKNNDKSFGDLVSMNENQMHPRMAKPSDFGSAPSLGDTAQPNTLWDMPENLEQTRHAEDSGSGKSGAGTPSTDRTAAVAKNFKSMQNSSEMGTKVAGPEYVDLKDGQHSCSFGMKK